MKQEASASQDNQVVLTGVSKQFVRSGGAIVDAIQNVDLTVNPEEILVLLGPSGCGKSTLLRCVGGLEHPTAGSIRIGGTTVFDQKAGIIVPPNERDVNMMFQSYALWPHMTLEANVAYPLRVTGTPKKQALARANDYLDLVGLNGLGRQYAGAISGGQAQRVALARTLISEPALVLFDEPLSNVDAKVRARLRSELARIHREVGFSAIYVTHDQIEAMGVGTRIAVMRAGRLDQVGDPVSVYENPTTRYTAEFIGEANLLTGRIASSTDPLWTVATPIGDVDVESQNFVRTNGAVPAIGDEVLLMVRPEHWTIARADDVDSKKATNAWITQIDSVMYAGSRTEYSCLIRTEDFLVWEMAAPQPLEVGTNVSVQVPPWAVRVVADE